MAKKTQELSKAELENTKKMLLSMLTTGKITEKEYSEQVDTLATVETELKRENKKEADTGKAYNVSDDGYDIAMKSYCGYEPRLTAKAGQYGKAKNLPLSLCDWLRGLDEKQYKDFVGDARGVAAVAEKAKAKNKELPVTAQVREQDKSEINAIKSDIAMLSSAVSQLVASLKSK
jgi:hypothetical protein